ncbi:MAG: TonB-dependent receptor [Flavobacteriaceae bacterium]|nr:TonB-dependent receptor [Flavobacteriaceae bacterium]
MKYFISLCLVIFGITFANAQNELLGTVTDNQNQAILATIYIPQLEKGTSTDEEGAFSIVNIPNGIYTVVFSALGYATESEKITFPREQATPFQKVLETSAIEMEEIIVSTPFHQLQSDNVMKVERITTAALTRSGAVNLSQGIDNITGVTSLSTGIGIGKPVIRGLSSNRVLTYSQGVRLENQQFGDEHGLGISSSGIESIEVIKGPASLLFGSDALGGVLYLNPERFAASNTTHADASANYFSNSEGINTTVGVKTSSENVKFLVRGGYASHVDYKTGSDYRVTNARYNEQDLKTGIQFQNKSLKSTLRYNYNRSNIGIPEEIGVNSTSRELLLPFQEIDNHIISLNSSFFFSNSSLDVKAGYLYNDRREFEDEEGEEEGGLRRQAAGDEAALRLKLTTYNYDVKYNLPDLGKIESIVGLQGMFQQNENVGEEILIPDANKTDFGIFGTTHIHLDKFDIQTGLRYDFRSIETEAARNPEDFNYIPSLDRDFNSFNAALGAKYDVNARFLVRINLASGFRAPNLAELASNGVHEGTNRYEIGNPNLDNEQNFQSDVSFEFRNEHIEVYLNGFYNSISDFIFISPTGDVIEDNTVFDYIQTDANLYGGEMNLHLHPHPLDWLHFESSFELVRGVIEDGGNLPLIPAPTLKNTVRIELENKGKFKSPFGFVTLINALDQDSISEFETRTGGYSLLNLGAGFSLNFDKVEMDMGINATNLTNKSYTAHLSRLKIDGIENAGRSINASVGIRF